MIKLTSYADGHVEFHIDDVRYLPDVLRDLASMGYDLSKCSKVITEIEEDQREKQEDKLRRDAIIARAAARNLPNMLKQLVEDGEDLSKCKEAIEEAEKDARKRQEELRKRRAADRRKASRSERLRAPRQPKPCRFLIAYNRAEEGAKVSVAEGLVYSDGHVACNGGWPSVGGESIDEFKKYVESCGYECSIEFID